jgi:DNA-binding FadR family transcriptional regulator
MAIEERIAANALGGAQRVRKAYEQVYDQLRELILSGQLRRGERLPTELALAEIFGASRGTVREALRLLVTEGLVRTTKGAGGGSYVTLPTVDYVSEFLARNVELLSLTDDVSLAEFLEAREVIEVFCVRRAAERRTDSDLERLAATLHPGGTGETSYELYLMNREFHAVLVDMADNTLLRLATQPIFSVMHTHLARSEVEPQFSQTVCSSHGDIYEQIVRGDSDAAAQQMIVHLEHLADVYRRIWRSGSPG